MIKWYNKTLFYYDCLSNSNSGMGYTKDWSEHLGLISLKKKKEKKDFFELEGYNLIFFKVIYPCLIFEDIMFKDIYAQITKHYCEHDLIPTPHLGECIDYIL